MFHVGSDYPIGKQGLKLIVVELDQHETGNFPVVVKS